MTKETVKWGATSYAIGAAFVASLIPLAQQYVDTSQLPTKETVVSTVLLGLFGAFRVFQQTILDKYVNAPVAIVEGENEPDEEVSVDEENEVWDEVPTEPTDAQRLI